MKLETWSGKARFPRYALVLLTSVIEWREGDRYFAKVLIDLP
jgi:hypothetical protein